MKNRLIAIGISVAAIAAAPVFGQATSNEAEAKTEKKVKTFLKSNDHTTKPLPAQLIRRSLPRKAKNK
jgi:hypothetical protein